MKTQKPIFTKPVRFIIKNALPVQVRSLLGISARHVSIQKMLSGAPRHVLDRIAYAIQEGKFA